MDRLSIEFICAFGMPPDDFARLAAGLGVLQIGMAPSPINGNPYGFEEWDLRKDPALLRATKAAMAEHGVAVAGGEGVLIMDGMDVADSEATLDIMAELGAPNVNAVVLEQDRPRAIDQFARFAEMAATRGMTATLEFMPLMWPANVSEALDLVLQSAAENARLLLDSMHFYRSGAATEDLAAIDPARIGYIQLCDVPMASSAVPPPPDMMQAYGQEAGFERLCPGEGDLPLHDFLKALPRDLTVGLEIPMLSKAQAGIAPADALRPCIKAARELLVGLD